MSQLSRLITSSGPGSGTVTSVSGGNNITITGVSTVNPTVNVSGTTIHDVQIGNALGSLTSIVNGLTGQVLTAVTGADPVWSAIPVTGVTSIAGNSGGAQTGAISLVTANATPTFVGAAGTITLDFFLPNLFLGTGGSITSGTANVGYGALSGASISSGSSNSFYGYEAGVSYTTGDNSTGIGSFAMFHAIAGASNNTALGGLSLYNLAGAGTGNTALGFNSASAYTTTESNNIIIGNTGVIADSGKIRIGTNGTHTATFIAGIDGVNVGSVAKVVTMASDQLGTATITAGTGISVTPGANTITIAATGTTSLTYTNVNTTPYVVLVTDEYLSVDTSALAITIQLPNAATLGRAFIIKDRIGAAATRNITVTTVGGAVNIDGATTFVMNTAFESINVIGNGSTYEVY